MNKELSEQNLRSLDQLIESFKKSIKKDLVDEKLVILKELFELKELIRQNDIWVLPDKLTSVLSKFEELEIEEQYLVESIPDYYEQAQSLSVNVKKTLQGIEKNHEDILEEFMTLSLDDQKKFIEEEKSSKSPVLEGFVPFLEKLPKDRQRMIIKELLPLMEPREPFNSAIKNNFEFAFVVAKKSNEPILLFEVLSKQDENLEKVFIERLQQKDLRLPDPGLFSYWGLLGLDLKIYLVQHELISIERFEPISRILSLQPKEENSIIWAQIKTIPLWKEIIAYLKQDPVLMESCLEKWPSLFREEK